VPVHHVSTVDWSFTQRPNPSSETQHLLARSVIVGPEQGAVHTELAVGSFAPGGWLAPHVHSFEEAIYILEGELALEIDGRVHHLVAGDYGLMNVGVWHALANKGTTEVRWLSVNTPMRLPADADRKDTYFNTEGWDPAAFVAKAKRWKGDASHRFVGHYEGTPPQMEALALPEEVKGRKPVGMDTALLAYSGISVKMLVDKGFGADLLTLFTVDYEPRGAAQAHDHPFEETYFFLAGECIGELDGKTYTLRAGDIIFASVGSVHGFYNNGTERVRWLETQAPQPPTRHSYRWVQAWTQAPAKPEH
jgi:quercetin dioxygenase-like cupin family protein